MSPIVLNGQRLPYVSSGKHLGNTLNSGVKNKDFQIKRGITIGKLNGVPGITGILLSYCTAVRLQAYKDIDSCAFL